jgi:ankyrin repeat protein
MAALLVGHLCSGHVNHLTWTQQKKKEMLSFLLKKGADPNYTSNGGYTSMDIASGLQTKGSRELVKLLLQAGFNIGKKNHWGEDYSSMVTRM